MGTITSTAFHSVTSELEAQGLASLLDASVEITKAFAACEQREGTPSEAIPEVLQATFNKLTEIAGANKVR